MRTMISRQAFLRGAVGAVATSALFPTALVRAEPAGAWSNLASAIGGKVLLPSDAGFSSGKQVFNSNYNGSSPAAVVAVTSQADVEKAVAFAAANRLKIAPRGGGHSYIGASSANGTMVLDLRGLTGGVKFDAGAGTVTVPAGDQPVCGTPGPGRCGPGDTHRQLPHRGRGRPDTGRWNGSRLPPRGPDL